MNATAELLHLLKTSGVNDLEESISCHSIQSSRDDGLQPDQQGGDVDLSERCMLIALKSLAEPIQVFSVTPEGLGRRVLSDCLS
jgi:hypothetical protein